MRFSIRDVLWLTVVVALALGWWVDHRQSHRWYELSITAASAMKAEGWDISLHSGWNEGPYFVTPGGRMWRPTHHGGQVTGMESEFIRKLPAGSPADSDSN